MFKVRVDATVLPVDATNVAASAGDGHEGRLSHRPAQRGEAMDQGSLANTTCTNGLHSP